MVLHDFICKDRVIKSKEYKPKSDMRGIEHVTAGSENSVLG